MIRALSSRAIVWVAIAAFHLPCPYGHALLGGQIAFVAVFLFLALIAVLSGFKVADCGFDLLENRGQIVSGLGLLIVGACIATAGGILIPWGGYLLWFDGGLFATPR